MKRLLKRIARQILNASLGGSNGGGTERARSISSPSFPTEIRLAEDPQASGGKGT